MSVEGKSKEVKGIVGELAQNDHLQEWVKSQQNKVFRVLDEGKAAVGLIVGMDTPIMFKRVIAGEYLKSWNMDQLIRYLTPKVPSLDRVFATVDVYFVPDTCVWKSAEKALAGKGNINPDGTVGGAGIVNIPSAIVNAETTQDQFFRILLASRYGVANYSSDTSFDLRLSRGYNKIHNAFRINKEYDSALVEFDEDEPTVEEVAALNGTSENVMPYIMHFSPVRKSYATNIKRRITAIDDTMQADVTQETHLDWQTQYNDNKQRQVNAQKNDWDIIAEMGGTRPVKTDRPEHIGRLEYQLNFQQLSQTTPTENTPNSPLGTTGSFSFTMANGLLTGHKRFQQHGYIHVIMSTSVEKMYECGTPKEVLKTKVEEEYRPGLAKKEIQLMYEKELFNNDQSQDGRTIAYQPAWAEYKRMPNLCTGQMREKALEESIGSGIYESSYAHWHNFIPDTGRNTITSEFFNNDVEQRIVLGRNNSFNLGEGIEEVFVSIAQHTVETALPIDQTTIISKDRAEETR